MDKGAAAVAGASSVKDQVPDAAPEGLGLVAATSLLKTAQDALHPRPALLRSNLFGIRSTDDP
jgi:hypothetical protein